MPELRLGKSKRLLLPVAAALAGAIALTACGGGGSSASGASSTTTAPSGSASLASYVQCLESHGVPGSVASTFGQRRGFGRGAASGSSSGESVPPASPPQSFARPTVPSQYQAAIQACRSLRPSFGGGINSAAFAAYRNCLQLHGVSLPTPPTGGGQGGVTGPGGSLSQLQNDPNFKAAQQACAALAPTRGTSTSTTTTPAAA